MAFPDNVETAPTPRATNLGSNDGTKHSVFDAATWATLGRVQAFLLGSSEGESTLLTRLNQIIAATQTLRTVNGTAAANAVAPSAWPATGLHFASNETYIASGGVDVVHVTATILQALKNLGVTEQVYAPNMATTVSGGLFVKWDSTAGQFLRATSQRARKENFRAILPERALGVVMQLRPTFFDDIARTVDRPGVTTDIPGLIAEELAEVGEPGMAAVDTDGTPIGRNDEAIITMLIGAVQFLAARVEALEAR